MNPTEVAVRQPAFESIANKWEIYFKTSEGLQGNEYGAVRDLARAALFDQGAQVHYLQVEGWIREVYGSSFSPGSSWSGVEFVLGQEIRDEPVMELFLREKMSGADVADLTGGGFKGRMMGPEANRAARATRNLMLMVLDVQPGEVD